MENQNEFGKYRPEPPQQPREVLSDILFAELLPHVRILEEAGDALDRGDGKEVLRLGIAPAFSLIAHQTGATPREATGATFRENWNMPEKPTGVHAALQEAWDAYEHARRINGVLHKDDIPHSVDTVSYNEDEKAASLYIFGYWSRALHDEIARRAKVETTSAQSDQSRYRESGPRE